MHIPYLGEFSTETVYLAGERVGLRFLIEEQPQADLVERLSALIRAGHAGGSDADDPADTAQAQEALEAREA